MEIIISVYDSETTSSTLFKHQRVPQYKDIYKNGINSSPIPYDSIISKYFHSFATRSEHS